jgi:hypothetical protein
MARKQSGISFKKKLPSKFLWVQHHINAEIGRVKGIRDRQKNPRRNAAASPEMPTILFVAWR